MRSCSGGRDPGPDEVEALWDELGQLDGAPRATADAPYLEPARDYESDSVPRGTARAALAGASEQWGVTELVIDGPSHGNPFVDVELSARFTDDQGHGISVGGFYDGDGVYRIRFCAPHAGTWTYVTTSTARSLDGLRGTFESAPPGPGNHGPVGVADRFHFAYRDGTRFLPAGTTCYAWTHQTEALQERTLTTLAAAPFRKLRMCVFPKSYLFNTNEPDRYPFARDQAGNWDFTRFDPEFFRHLERRIEPAHRARHRDGPDPVPPVRPLGLLRDAAGRRRPVPAVPRPAAGRAPGRVVVDGQRVRPDGVEDGRGLGAPGRTSSGENDHVGHLTSIHNCFGFYDHARPWITHCSIQRTDVYRTAENTTEWREAYGKPVVIDECGYEGDIDQGWGNLSGQELVRRCWEGAVRGGYVGHGETYLNEREELWWSKGGELTGDAPPRIGFLLEVTEAAPGGVLEPLPGDWDVAWGGTEDYRIAYFGFGRPRYRDITMPPGTRWHADVIDTWNMTVDRQPGTFEGRFRIELPGREFMAIRLTRAEG